MFFYFNKLRLLLYVWAAFFSIAAIAQKKVSEFQPTSYETRLKAGVCDLWTDPKGVPHVRAADDETAWGCLGFLHGKDRAFPMEFFRRTVQGRRAEIVGHQGIRTDYFFRLLQFEKRAKDITAELSPRIRTLLTHYVRGVNRGFEEALKRDVPEFSKFRILPEPWLIEHTVQLLLLQALDQTRMTFEQDVKEQRWLDEFGPRAGTLFHEDDLPWETPILKKDEFASLETPAQENPTRSLTNAPVEKMFGLQTLLNFYADPSIENYGSNSFVVAPQLTRSGKSWLANDPHVNLTDPPFWHFAHFQGHKINVMGAFFPGIPFMVSGTNMFVSIGVTAAKMKTAQVYHVADSELTRLTEWRPWIKFKWGPLKLPFFFKKIAVTEEGWPVLPIETPKGVKAVLRWSLFDVTARDLDAIEDMMLAENVSQMDSALRRVGVPCFNLVFADVHGQIGYRVIGKVPRRMRESEFGIEKKTIAEIQQEWSYLKPNEMPHVINPKKGYTVTANNRQWPRAHSLKAGRAYSLGFRGARIEELISVNRQKHDGRTLGAAQCDVMMNDARYLLPLLLTRLGGLQAELGKNAKEAFAGWNFQATTSCVPCFLFRRWMDVLMDKTHINTVAIYRILKESLDLPKFDTALVEAFQEVWGMWNANSRYQLWGEVHQNPFTHVTEHKLFEDGFSISSPGDTYTVNPGSMRWERGLYMQSAGASLRFLIEMTRPPTVLGQLAGPNTREVHARKEMEDPSSPWSKWSRCELEKQEFPVDWLTVRTSQIIL